MEKQNDHRDPQWQELKRLLLEEEKQRLSTIEGKVLHPEDFSHYISQVLADAVQFTEDKSRLSQKLYPVVEESLYKSVQKNPESLADAIYPVITPAIRKAINDALRKLTESVNQTVNQGLTARSLKWRIQALFSKHSYGDLVLKYSLLYQVEEVYLIHNETGLLIRHRSQQSGDNPDGDMISGMLTAIRDFVSDSFHTRDSLDRIEVGDLTVVLRQGPHATLAAVVRGDPSSHLDDTLSLALENIHRDFGTDLDHFKGDTSALEDTDLFLNHCLLTELDYQAKPAQNGKLNSILAVGGSALFLLIALAVYLRIESGRLERMLAKNGYEVLLSDRKGRINSLLVSQSFYKVDSIQSQSPGDLDQIIAAFSKGSLLKPRLFTGVNPYRSERSRIMTFLGRDSLLVDVVQTGQNFRLSGHLPFRKITRIREMLPLITEVAEFDYSQLVASEYVSLLEMKGELEQILLFIDPNRNEIQPDQTDTIVYLNELLLRFNSLCREMDAYWQLEVTGSASVEAADRANQQLEKDWALYVVDQFIDQELDHLYVKGVASTMAKKERVRPLISQPAHWNHVSFEIKPVHP